MCHLTHYGIGTYSDIIVRLAYSFASGHLKHFPLDYIIYLTNSAYLSIPQIETSTVAHAVFSYSISGAILAAGPY